MASEEIKPLLRSPYQESRDLLSETSESSESSQTSQIVVTAVDEVPPPSYTSISGGGYPFIYCKVCQSMINISGKVTKYKVSSNPLLDNLIWFFFIFLSEKRHYDLFLVITPSSDVLNPITEISGGDLEGTELSLSISRKNILVSY